MSLPFSILVPPTLLSNAEVVALLSGYKTSYNVSDKINISLDKITVKSSLFDVLCIDSTNGTLVDEIYNSTLFTINDNLLTN